MYRWLRRIALGSGLMLTGAAVAVFFLYRAATAPVPEYQALVEQTRQQLETGEIEQNRQELESQLAALYSDAAEATRWETTITELQLNSWLATQLVHDFPELAEQGVYDPRVLIKAGAVTLAMRAELHGMNAVVAFDLEPFVAEDGSLALELAAARVGSAPLPTAQIMDQLNAAMGDEGLPGRWSTSNGNPVLLIDFEQQASSFNFSRSLDAIEVRQGEVYIAGETLERAPRVAEVSR